MDQTLFEKIRYEDPIHLFIHSYEMSKEQLFLLLKQYQKEKKKLRKKLLKRKTYYYCLLSLGVCFLLIGSLGTYFLLIDWLGPSRIGRNFAIIIGTIWFYTLIWLGYKSKIIDSLKKFEDIDSISDDLRDTKSTISYVKSLMNKNLICKD